MANVIVSDPIREEGIYFEDGLKVIKIKIR
jgi:hypothetical protein